MRRNVFSVLAMLAVGTLTACATSPTGRSQIMMVSSEEAAQMGSASFRELQQKEPISRDSRANNYVQCVARTITAELGQAGQGWEVTTFASKELNAFALPGRKIGVYVGIFKAAQTQDQLAAVIGHEVAHVLSKHSEERLSDQQALGIGSTVAAIFAQSQGVNLDPNMTNQLGQVFFLLPFSRTHESEADIIGLDLMARAGFDPRQAVNLWQNMSRQGGAKPPELLSTHPSDETRLRAISQRLEVSMPIYEQARSQGKRPNCGSPG